jgi:hypothetical protein
MSHVPGLLLLLVTFEAQAAESSGAGSVLAILQLLFECYSSGLLSCRRWLCYVPGHENPLDEQEHVMARPELRGVVQQILDRAESIHGEGMLQEAGLQRLSQLCRGYVLV